MDALTFAHAADGFTIDYSYLWNVNRVFKGSRSSVQESDFDSNSHALVAGRRTNLGNFSGFLYAYDFDNAAATSSISYGASYTGTFDALTVAATYARQRDHADNPQPYDADYLMLEGSGKIHLGRVPEWQLRFSWPHHGCRAGDRLDRAGARPAHARGSAPGQLGQTSGAALNFQGIFSIRIHQGNRSRSVMQSYLEISNVGIEFHTESGKFRALENVNLKIERGEFISLIGHSGCGKSTVLNIVAGLYQATEGGVILDNREVSAPSPDRAVVFQNHALLPWLTV